MTNPLVDGLKSLRSPLTATQWAVQDVSTRRADEITRVMRRAGDIKTQATDKASTNEPRGLTRAASELSRGTAVLQAADQGLEAIGTALKRVVVLIDKAAEPSVSPQDVERLQNDLETLRRDVLRIAQQSNAILQPSEGSLGTVSHVTGSGATVSLPALPSVNVNSADSTTTSLGTAATSSTGNTDYPAPTVPGVVANNVSIAPSTTAVAQTVTVKGQLFELGSFIPDAKSLAAAINQVQGEIGVLEAHADPNVLVGVSTRYDGRGGRGHDHDDDHGDDRSWPPAWGRRARELLDDWPGRGPFAARHGHTSSGSIGHHDDRHHDHHGSSGGRMAPSGTFTINGTRIEVAAAARASDADRRAAAISAINAVSADTGVVASDNGRGVTLTAADGRNITVQFNSDVRRVSASTFGVATTGAAGQTSTIDLRYLRPCGCANGTVEFSATTGLDPQFRLLTVRPLPSTTPSAVPQATPTEVLPVIDLADTENLSGARQRVESTLDMVAAARGKLATLSERIVEAIDDTRQVMVGATTLESLRFVTATGAEAGALRLRELIMRDWATGFAAQANSSRTEALRALQE